MLLCPIAKKCSNNIDGDSCTVFFIKRILISAILFSIYEWYYLKCSYKLYKIPTNDTHNLIKICVYSIFKQKTIHNYNDLFMPSLLCKSLFFLQKIMTYHDINSNRFAMLKYEHFVYD